MNKTDTHDLLGLIDVKCPRIEGVPETFWVTQNKRNNQAAYYALVTIMERCPSGQINTVFWGAARKEWVFSDENLTRNRAGSFYELSVDALEPLVLKVDAETGAVEAWPPLDDSSRSP